MKMKSLLLAMLVSAPFAVSAATGTFKDTCSMKASKMTKKADLVAMATIKPMIPAVSPMAA